MPHFRRSIDRAVNVELWLTSSIYFRCRGASVQLIKNQVFKDLTLQSRSADIIILTPTVVAASGGILQQDREVKASVGFYENHRYQKCENKKFEH